MTIPNTHSPPSGEPRIQKKSGLGGRKYEKGAHGCDIVQQLSILTESPHHPICTLFRRRVPNMTILYRIFLTIPVTSAHAERSFSHLKLIKSYLRSVMGQERLTSLSLLSIERGISSKCDYDSVIDNFAAMKTRRKKL